MKKPLKIILSSLAAVLALFMLLVCANIIANTCAKKSESEYAKTFEAVKKDDVIVPKKDENGYTTFTTDREFKILDLTDIHISGGWKAKGQDKMAMNAVCAMIKEEKPDLVIVTGDIAYAVPDTLTINNKAPAEIFAQLMEQNGIYWTLTFGNHDSEVYDLHSREKIADFYANSNFKYCLFEKGDDKVDGYGNHVINVKNTKGEITQSLILFDSHAYANATGIGAGYANIHENQIEWYKNTVKDLKAYNASLDAGIPSSLAFFHIPLEEYKTAWNEYVGNNYTDTENTKWLYGAANEEGDVVYCGSDSDNLFETFSELGSTKGIFCGHDHINNFSMNYKGIRLTYGMSIDYTAYKWIHNIGDYRGCTVITLSPDGSFDCKSKNYYTENFNSQYEKEEVTFRSEEK